MLPSEKLRQLISKRYNINLEQYAWPEELKNKILSISLDKELETNASTLEEIYNEGFNIGHCGLTSRYIALNFKEANLFYGKTKLLIDTPSAPNGEHAWTIINNYLIDTTLMIIIPINKLKELGYIPEKEIAYDSARLLSEYDRYDNEYTKNNQRKK